MREREVLGIAKALGMYDKKLDFVEVSPEELVDFANEIESRVYDQLVTKLHLMVDKL